MDHFAYRRGELHAEDVSIAALADKVGTPFYCYSQATLERHYRVFRDALKGLDATVCYAVKANSNLAVIATLARLGAGADVVSGGELKRALAAGVPAGRIVFSGVGKTADEMAFALEVGAMQINVESEPELDALDAVARRMGKRAPVALRVNPDVDAHTHAKITTGRSENKFGIEWTRAHEVYRRAANLPGIRAVGIAVHIGSQLTELQPFEDAFARVRDLVQLLRADGHAIERLDLGGGLGIPYESADTPTPSPAEYGAVVRRAIGGLGVALTFEPGRLLVGNGGVLVTRVLYVKEGATRTFVIVDAGMNDLIRPALYDAYHAVWPVREAAPGAETRPVDIVGPVCETGDTFARERPLTAVAAGDLLVFRTAGAYGATMASTYNTRPLTPEVLVSGDEAAVVRARMEVEDFLAHEALPAWFGGTATAPRTLSKAPRRPMSKTAKKSTAVTKKPPARSAKRAAKSAETNRMKAKMGSRAHARAKSKGKK